MQKTDRYTRLTEFVLMELRRGMHFSTCTADRTHRRPLAFYDEWRSYFFIGQLVLRKSQILESAGTTYNDILPTLTRLRNAFMSIGQIIRQRQGDHRKALKELQDSQNSVWSAIILTAQQLKFSESFFAAIEGDREGFKEYCKSKLRFFEEPTEALRMKEEKAARGSPADEESHLDHGHFLELILSALMHRVFGGLSSLTGFCLRERAERSKHKEIRIAQRFAIWHPFFEIAEIIFGEMNASDEAIHAMNSIGRASAHLRECYAEFAEFESKPMEERLSNHAGFVATHQVLRESLAELGICLGIQFAFLKHWKGFHLYYECIFDNCENQMRSRPPIEKKRTANEK